MVLLHHVVDQAVHALALRAQLRSARTGSGLGHVRRALLARAARGGALRGARRRPARRAAAPCALLRALLRWTAAGRRWHACCAAAEAPGAWGCWHAARGECLA